MRVRVNGAWEDIDSGLVRVGNAWKQLASIRVYVGGAWKEGKTFVPALSLAITPDVGVSGSRTGAGLVTTTAATATPTGGLAPYTYAWVNIGGVGSPNTPASATTTFSATLGSGDDTFGDFQCTVTDSLGTTATAVTTAFFTSNDPGGF